MEGCPGRLRRAAVLATIFSARCPLQPALRAACTPARPARAAAAVYQVDTEGDALTAAAISSSGECLAFGGSGGYVHLWAHSHDPAVNQMRQVGSQGQGRGPRVHVGAGSGATALLASPTSGPPCAAASTPRHSCWPCRSRRRLLSA